ncbi:helix-turn-helix domain-containing protein [Streptomyces sp. NPDC004376]
MKIRADIAALLRQGHTNASIAHRLGCDRTTVANARRALRLPPADKLGRIYAEAFPTGRVKDWKRAGFTPLPPAQQDAHWRELCAAVGTPNARRPTPTVNGPHRAA